MDSLRKAISSRERAAALIIVLAFVVLLTGLTLAYLTRTTGDRQVAQSSFNQSKVNQITASGMDLVIGALRQEITGPSPTPTPPYLPATAANMLPTRSGNPAGAPDPIPNLVRRSIRGDPILAPGLSSLASAVNSTTDVSANGRFISLPRWNKHYLIPRPAGASPTDTTPISGANGFTAPDWVILTRAPSNPADPTSPYPVAFSTWDPVLKDPTVTNNLYAVGRFAYAIYDEGGLLDANVAGYPTNTTAAQYGPKGASAFADLTALGITQPAIDAIVGWRNYFSAQPSGTFPNFVFNSTAATSYVKGVLSNTTGFMTVPIPVPAPTTRTDQLLPTRQSLIQLLLDNTFSLAIRTANANAFQYLTTFSRELNAPTWKPSTPAGSTIDYATLANTPTADTSTAINRDLLKVRTVGAFTRADGTTTAVGDLLINRRFPLSRINGLGPNGAVTTVNSTIVNGVPSPATDPPTGGGTISRDFGLHWNSDHWDYVGASGTTVQTAIKRLDEVAAANREPNFFELLKAGILSGSVGRGSSGATFVAADPKYVSSDYQIMQIGANIIDQWDSDNVPTFIDFGSPASELAGIENLPYLNKLVFKPYWSAAKTAGQYQFDAWLLPSLWNPHQNAPPASQNIRIIMTAGTLSATTSNPAVTMTSITGGTNQYMTVDASSFGTVANPSTNNPSGPTAVTDKPKPPGTITQSADVTNPAGGYYGFHVNSTANALTAPGASTTARPNIAGCTFQLQVDVTGKGNWKAYQTWTGCSQPATPLICSPTGLSGNSTLQDPEFVTLDPRTLRFGVWGNDALHSASPGGIDYTSGVLTTLERSAGTYEAITALPPQGTGLSLAAGPPYPLYNYANNLDATTHYTDFDTLQRRGDISAGTTTTAMLPADYVDRPQIVGTLNRPFQSVAELGRVFRDEPWKTLDFFMTTASPDAGLLDIFTLHESSMEAGKTSFNTRQKPVLTAILSQVTKRLNGAGVINSTTDLFDLTNIVNAVVALQPMIRKTELLTGLAGTGTVTGLGNKEAQELVGRAFSDAGQTRTWNLLIDVIAQSGRYPPNASTLAGFLVEGEQHYWVHVAIDRFTGQVVDKQIEVVNE